MSVALPCPHCRQAVVPRLRPVGIKTAYDPEADLRQHELSAQAPCPECHGEIAVRGIWNERGQFLRVVAVDGIDTAWSTCTTCRNPGLKRIDSGPLFLPPTGGDFEWVDTTSDCFCPICAQSFTAGVRYWAEPERYEIVEIEPREDWWSEQFVLAEVYYARGEIYSIGTVRAFRNEAGMRAFWARCGEAIAPLAAHPESFEFQLLRSAADRYWDDHGQALL